MNRQYEELSMIWQNMTLSIRMKRNYSPIFQKVYGHELVHLTIKAKDKLPITSTGFKSIFLSMDQLIEAEGIVPFVDEVLNHAAQSSEWKKYYRKKGQLSLF